MAEPITDPQWGKADWADYENNWREADAEFLQARTILRFQTDTARNDALGAAPPGTVVYNDATDRLELRSKTATWKGVVPLPVNLKVDADSTTEVKFSHLSGTGKGITFTPTDIKIPLPLDVHDGVVKIGPAGLDLKVGTATARLSTDATDLVSDKALKAPAISLTGADGTVVINATGKTINVGTLAAATVTATNVTLGAGGTLTSPTINGTSATIGGVGISANAVSAPSGFNANGGIGFFSADASKATVQARNAALPGGTLRPGKIEVDDNVGLTGTLINLNSDTAVRNKTIGWYDSTSTFKGYYAVSVYSATDPGATNFPEGTIWFS